MAHNPNDSHVPLSVDEADQIARDLSVNRMGAIKTGDGVVDLIHVGKRVRGHLLAFQLTKRGIITAVTENEPWPEIRL